MSANPLSFSSLLSGIYRVNLSNLSSLPLRSNGLSDPDQLNFTTWEGWGRMYWSLATRIKHWCTLISDDVDAVTILFDTMAIRIINLKSMFSKCAKIRLWCWRGYWIGRDRLQTTVLMIRGEQGASQRSLFTWTLMNASWSLWFVPNSLSFRGLRGVGWLELVLKKMALCWDPV